VIARNDDGDGQKKSDRSPVETRRQFAKPRTHNLDFVGLMFLIPSSMIKLTPTSEAGRWTKWTNP
jgi:hypothetical protein